MCFLDLSKEIGKGYGAKIPMIAIAMRSSESVNALGSMFCLGDTMRIIMVMLRAKRFFLPFHTTFCLMSVSGYLVFF